MEVILSFLSEGGENRDGGKVFGLFEKPTKAYES